MIIHSIQAQNFMRFQSLRLHGLPGEGLVGIMGDNETGKSTLGHAIIYSLFGEAPGGQLDRLIHWDADQMKIAMQFAAEGHGTFIIYREIDRRGTNYVRLRNKGDEKDSCSGTIAVGKRLEKILGVTPEEFKVSFFLAEGDIDFLRPGRSGPSPILDRILGLAPVMDLARSADESLEEIRRGVAQISEELKVRDSIYQGSFEDPERELFFIKDIDELKEEVERAKKQVETLTATEADIGGEISAREGGLERLESMRTGRDLHRLLDGVNEMIQEDRSPSRDPSVTKALEGKSAERETLQVALGTMGDYLQRHGALRDAVGKVGDDLYDQIREHAGRSRTAGKRYFSLSRWLRRTRFLIFLFLILAGSSLGWWVYALRTYPADQLIPILGGGMEWDRETLLWALSGVAAVSTVLFYFTIRWSLGLHRRRLYEERLKKATEDALRDLEERKAFCVNFAARGSDLPAAQIEDLGEDAAAKALADLQEKHPKIASEGHATSPLWEEISEATKAIVEALDEKKEVIVAERGSREEVLREKEGRLHEVDDSLAAFRQKQEMLKSLGKEKAALERDLLEVRREAKIHETLANEAREAADGMRRRFGPSLARFLKPILPMVTRGRYSNVRVGPDLSVQVFSPAKNDFLSLRELSGGTLEQILLAIRLGFSQALVLSRGAPGLGPQFLFLDEPFPSSDRERSTQFARVLQQMGTFPQIFVTTQVPEVLQEGYDLIVETRLDLSDLSVSGTDGEESQVGEEMETPPTF